MAATDMNAVVHIMDANGNVNNIFPATKIANVDGLQSALNAKADSTTVTNQLSGKVDKVTGKGLSTNDYTTAEKNKLSGIADGATANIGTVTSVKVGNTAYNPSSGVVSLPAYPTDTNTHRPIQVNGTQILGDNTTPLNLKAGSNVSILNSDGTVTIAATDTTYSAATQSANGLMSTTDKSKLDGIANNANNYVHPTTSGNKHIPSGGSSGKILGWSADGTAAWIDEPSKGTVTSVKVGSTSYSPSSGIVSLPEYVTFGTKGVFTKVMSSLVIRDGSYMIKNNIFYVANIFFTTISNVSANTETTLATASSLPTYEVKAVATVYKNDNSSILTDSAILKIKEDGTVTITSPVAIGSGTNSGRINNIRLIDLSA